MLKIDTFIEHEGVLCQVEKFNGTIKVPNSEYLYGALEIVLEHDVIFSRSESDDDIVFLWGVLVNAFEKIKCQDYAEEYFPSMPMSFVLIRTNDNLHLMSKEYDEPKMKSIFHGPFEEIAEAVKRDGSHFFKKLLAINPIDSSSYIKEIERLQYL